MQACLWKARRVDPGRGLPAAALSSQPLQLNLQAVAAAASAAAAAAARKAGGASVIITATLCTLRQLWRLPAEAHQRQPLAHRQHISRLPLPHSSLHCCNSCLPPAAAAAAAAKGL